MTTPPRHDEGGAADRETVTTRVFAAARERVFEAFADPAQLAQWWGPKGFTSTIHELDLVPGGRMRLEMRGPDGAVYPMEKRVVEAVRPERIVLRHEQPMHNFFLAMTFAEEAGGTRLTWRMRFDTAAEYAAVEPIVAKANHENLDRLATHLSRMGAADTKRVITMQQTPTPPRGGFTIERTFKAAPEKVWKMWTTKDGLEKWFVPDGMTSTVTKLDVRVGGEYAIQFRMQGDGPNLVNHGTYAVVNPYTHLAMTWHFDIFLAPGEKPYDVPIAISFHALPNGGTRMVFTEGPLATPEFTEGSRQGVESNFAKLAAALGE